ncbi:hypothetical protein [Paraflavitalea speifideaquila]|uniref:hypothetical protein n=1 Tax=Paraflavitalea speifideaquila TaxID=3076558 RepID=UPI0028E4BFC8|nr:hypothetical protein [Paraflavitalea speifideiaquila]
MARSQETFNKREREKQRIKKQQDKQEKMKERKSNKDKGNSLENMMAYLDENGNLTTTPPNPAKNELLPRKISRSAFPSRKIVHKTNPELESLVFQ